jgi:hypothetical protein
LCHQKRATLFLPISSSSLNHHYRTTLGQYDYQKEQPLPNASPRLLFSAVGINLVIDSCDDIIKDQK